jgi:UDP-N-acetylmuramate-alanine ligase
MVGAICIARQARLAVAGTHGKTTTTTMVAWILEQAGLESRFFDWWCA